MEVSHDDQEVPGDPDPGDRSTLLALIQTGKAAARTLTHARLLLKVALKPKTVRLTPSVES